ncbi:MAG: hypothetical protein WCQ26_11810, partial [Pseudanabaena sp. ELA748]
MQHNKLLISKYIQRLSIKLIVLLTIAIATLVVIFNLNILNFLPNDFLGAWPVNAQIKPIPKPVATTHSLEIS